MEEQGDHLKLDHGKARYELVPWDAFEEVVKVINFGAQKYADRGWEQGTSWGRLIGATFRHVTAWAMGEENASDSGLNHLAHAACNCLFLIAYARRGLGKDDRVKVLNGSEKSAPSLERNGFRWA